MTKIQHLIRQLATIRAINRHLSGARGTYWGNIIFDDKVVFDGNVFIGDEAPHYLKRLYPLLKNRDIGPEHMQILFDIYNRYYNVPRYLNKGETVCEVGAYNGFHALRQSDMVGPSGKVIAIEADPDNYKLLLRNTFYRTNIKPVNIAAWSEKGELNLFRQERQATSLVEGVVEAKDMITVACDKLDNLIDHADYFRIQVNGAEMEVLRGMERLLKHKPRLQIAALYNDRKEILRFLRDHGYKTHVKGCTVYAEI